MTTPRSVREGLLSALIIAGISLLGAAIPGSAQAQTTFLVTSGPEAYQEPFRTRLLVWTQMRFDPNASIVHLDSGQTVPFSQAKIIIYYGLYPTYPSQAFRDQLRSWLVGASDRWLVWLGNNGASFSFSDWGFYVSPQTIDGTTSQQVLNYRGAGGQIVDLDFTHASRMPAMITNSTKAKSEAYFLTNSGSYYDVAVSGTRDASSGKVLFVGFHPTSYMQRTGAHLAVTDLLHGVFQGFDSTEKRMFVRFEDVSAGSTFSSIQFAHDYLISRNVPVTFALIPVYKKANPPTVKHISPLTNIWTDSPSISDSVFRQNVINALVRQPTATVVAHGLTHFQSDVSGNDFEFATCTGGPPQQILDVPVSRFRADSAVRELVEAGLSDPTVVGSDRIIGWETPHYCATDDVMHNAFESRFDFIFQDAWWESLFPALQTHERTLPWLPYYVGPHWSTTYLQTYHGYVASAADVSRITLEASKLAKLRYRVESAFFFHADQRPRTELESIITTMQTQGWQFPSLSSVFGVPTRRAGMID